MQWHMLPSQIWLLEMKVSLIPALHLLDLILC
jgi:hypothetical protein